MKYACRYDLGPDIVYIEKFPDASIPSLFHFYLDKNLKKIVHYSKVKVEHLKFRNRIQQLR